MKSIAWYHRHDQHHVPLHTRHTFFRGVTAVATCGILISVMTGCTLQKNEHTVHFQQLHQTSEQSKSLPVWMEVYSESVVHDVYPPQQNTEFLP